MSGKKGVETKAGSAKGLGRRLFLKASACVAFLAAAPAWVWAFFVEELQVRTVEKETFRFDPATGQVEWKDKKVKGVLAKGTVLSARKEVKRPNPYCEARPITPSNRGNRPLDPAEQFAGQRNDLHPCASPEQNSVYRLSLLFFLK